MITKNIPSLIHSPKGYDEYVFDKNGRFFYIKQHNYGKIPVFFVYDSIFNEYIQLNPGPSILALKNTQFDFAHNVIRIFEPIDLNRILIILTNGDFPSEAISICLIYLDFKQKTYELLDKYLLENCASPKIIFDEESGEKFGLFCETFCTDGRWEDEEAQEPLKVYTLQNFHINELNKIIKNSSKEFDYNCEENPVPKSFYLFEEKLWFVREKCQIDLNQTEQNEGHELISYFDLEKENTQENVVEVIKENKYGSNIKWRQNFLIYHVINTHFLGFNLHTFQWIKIEASLNFYGFYCENLRNKEDKWTTFCFYGHGENRHFIDKEFNLLAVKKDEKCLYRVPLRSPQKLLDLSWNEALNNNFINKLSCSPFECVF